MIPTGLCFYVARVLFKRTPDRVELKPRSMLSIVLVDDHKILQQGLQRSLECTGELKVVAFADSAKDGLFKVEQYQPDVGIFDLGLPDHSGLWLIRRVRKLMPDLPILILSMHTDREVVATALRNGANGYLCKSADEKTLLNAVKTIHAGGRFLLPEVEKELAELDSEEGAVSEKFLDQAYDTVLTDKEMEILRLTSAGWSNGDMAKEVGVSLSTIKSRLRSIFCKLNVENRTEAVAAAISLGIIIPPHD